jgi:hypothetical protein
MRDKKSEHFEGLVPCCNNKVKMYQNEKMYQVGNWYVLGNM